MFTTYMGKDQGLEIGWGKRLSNIFIIIMDGRPEEYTVPHSIDTNTEWITHTLYGTYIQQATYYKKVQNCQFFHS